MTNMNFVCPFITSSFFSVASQFMLEFLLIYLPLMREFDECKILFFAFRFVLLREGGSSVLSCLQKGEQTLQFAEVVVGVELYSTHKLFSEKQ